MADADIEGSDIIGHQAALAELRGAVARGGLHHAYLIEGPRGVGKRRLADHLARLANCTADGPRPCGRCETCVAIAAGRHPDVIVLEPDLSRASRTIPIDAVREAIRQSQYHRYGARHRFIVVDPADAMQEPAANALLKTLEEPPAATHFLLITHNARALLPTIRSRCQRMRLGAVDPARIRDWLVARGIDPEAASSATRLASGSPGRALVLAEEGLAARSALRASLCAALDGGLDAVYAFSAEVAQGARTEWAERAEQVLQIVEDLARDATLLASGSDLEPLDVDAEPFVARLAGAWPQGITRCAQAVQDARDDLEVYVSGKTVLDALLTAVQRELPR
ncbi:MAG: DNA polymerase III subunit delta' [Myxococcota bacterium]